VSVSVTTPSGRSAVGPFSAYTYIALESISPTGGPRSGSTKVILRGSGLNGIDTLWFGDRPATDFKVVSDHEIEAVTPPGSGDDRISIGQIGEPFSGEPPTGLFFDYGEAPKHAVSSGLAAVEGAPLARTGHARSAATAPLRANPASGSPALIIPVGGALLAILGGIFFTPIILGGGLLAGSIGLSLSSFLGLVSGYIFTANLKALGYGPSAQFSGLIDPSGAVSDTNGNPISSATAVLEQAPTAEGPFRRANPASPGIEPHVNPQQTRASGQFHWDVISGFYKVVASATGCHAPGDASQNAASTPVLPVPPPQVGLDLVLQCAHEAPPARPRITSLSKVVVRDGGGADIEIVGVGFTPASKVHFGPGPALAVTFVSPGLLEATVPPGRGSVHVLVSTAGGTSAPGPGDLLIYRPAPVITSVSPASGPLAGGTRITIRGSGLATTEIVRVGLAFVTNFKVDSDSTIEATLPPGRQGIVKITIMTSVGWSGPNDNDRFRYAERLCTKLCR
jgi:hypothetical protein